MPTKVWQPGEEVTSAEFNPLVQEQVVPTFATPAERDAAITAPKVGQLCYVNGPGVEGKLLLQYTDATTVPGWHRLWNEPWGEIAHYTPADVHFGGWQWVIGGGFHFPTSKRIVQVRLTGQMYKDVDGNDAHTVLRMMVSGDAGTGLQTVRDAVCTLHQGWAGYAEVSEMIPTDFWPEVHFQVMCTWGTAWLQWPRITLIDMGPTVKAAQP